MPSVILWHKVIVWKPVALAVLATTTRRAKGVIQKTGEKVLVPEKRVPHFKAGLEMRERVDQSVKPQAWAQTQPLQRAA